MATRAFVAVALFAAACTTPPAGPPRLAPYADCAHPPSPDQVHQGLQGPSRGGTAVALLFSEVPMKAGDEQKIVWRVTGTGPIRIFATGPAAQVVQPVWGPEEHGGSTFAYPGGEWGVGFRFTAPGCWTVHVARDDVEGSLSLPVT
ncbi:hypothetical protein QRX60_07175 [Amycolatopsis mongoliensis]|uniref:Uncharacterized protein n=1 Tax=Amycolatopsis mongoliensis TaxID=715475 RepID=A0A9Y2JS12_9PSEU|nr:hypothetical protein [Amycolatopsis sp. 4-36]WIY03628.1 hypothetical protein QRX60_07175 [Amycolatopsis sp. 4-36]